MIKRTLVFGVSILLLVPFISIQDSPMTTEDVPSGISPTIDGIISPEEWVDANVKTVELTSSDNSIKFADRYLKFSNSTFYFALVVGGESEEVYVWLGDDELQAWQEGTDLKRCPKPDSYACSDWYYEGIYDFVEDDQQDVSGAGHYDATADKTTVEIEIPFDSGDIHDYRIEHDKIITIIYGSIHESSPAREFTKSERVRLWKRIVEWWKEEADHLWGIAAIYREAREGWLEEAEYWKKEVERGKELGDKDKIKEAEEKKKESEKYADRAEQYAQEAEEKARLYETFAAAYGEEAHCPGTLLIVVLVVGIIALYVTRR